MQLIQTHVWSIGNSEVETLEGKFRYIDWLKEQKKRLGENPKRSVKIKKRINGEGEAEYSLWATPYCTERKCHNMAINFNAAKSNYRCKKHSSEKRMK
jgi:hypothetical protein